MHWISTYRVINAGTVQGNSSPHDIPFNMLSEEYVLDDTIGKYSWHWVPVTWEGHEFEFWQSYELTFAATEAKTTCTMRIDGTSLTRTRDGPFNSLVDLFASTIFINTPPNGYQWNLALSRPAGWSEVP
jgi:hypothetical protein